MTPYMYSFILSLLFLLVTLYFVKSRAIDFKYSIFWSAISVLFIVLSLNKDLTEWIAGLVNIAYAPAFLFVTGIVFIFAILFYLTVVISKMQDKITVLIQEVGILKSDMDKEAD